jgi:O-antigen biosynthesis protein
MGAPSAMAATVAIVIPNYNGRALLERYLPAVTAAAAAGGARVVIADDASSDDGAAWVREHYPAVTVLAYAENLGFAGNVNRAVRDVDAEVIVLLNSDVEPEPGFMAPLIARLGRAEVFAAVPAIREGPGEVGYIRVRFRRGLLDFVRPAQGDFSRAPDRPTATAYACGAAMAFPRAKFLELGGFDQLFSPYYGEDLDLSYRAWKRGWRIEFEPTGRVAHQHSATIGRGRSEAQMRRIRTRQYMIFQWKNLSDPGFIAAHLFFLPLRVLAYAAYPPRWPELRGIIAALARLPRALRARSRPAARGSDREVIARINAG